MYLLFHKEKQHDKIIKKTFKYSQIYSILQTLAEYT